MDRQNVVELSFAHPRLAKADNHERKHEDAALFRLRRLGFPLIRRVAAPLTLPG
jgi:hypothetical protein